jgi:hypothetical protein
LNPKLFNILEVKGFGPWYAVSSLSANVIVFSAGNSPLRKNPTHFYIKRLYGSRIGFSSLWPTDFLSGSHKNWISLSTRFLSVPINP